VGISFFRDLAEQFTDANDGGKLQPTLRGKELTGCSWLSLGLWSWKNGILLAVCLTPWLYNLGHWPSFRPPVHSIKYIPTYP